MFTPKCYSLGQKKTSPKIRNRATTFLSLLRRKSDYVPQSLRIAKVTGKWSKSGHHLYFFPSKPGD
uniref:Uncharacterized protein n=1 Tax=Picea glauca TaxID=3330 RepID=A0A101LVR5_PICGL|nr:hypothetical protein ABT39_MTgene1770 [Picea glauca]